MTRYEMVICDFVFPEGDSCGYRLPTDIAPQQGWHLGDGHDLCPVHRPRTGGGPGGGTPIPLRRTA